MLSLLIFSGLLVVAILISERAKRTVLSTSVLFLCAGAFAGSDMVGWLNIKPGDQLVRLLAEVAVFTVLLTDGLQVGIRQLAAGWRQPGRVLLVGMPLTLLGTAVLARSIAGMPWLESLLLGAILSSTDPVLVSAIAGNQQVPGTLRHLLTVESGLNDGLALPMVLILIRVLEGETIRFWSILLEVGGGVAIGIGVPWVILRIQRTRAFGPSERYAPLVPFAVGALVLSLCSLLHANEYLAAFAAGVTIASLEEDLSEMFHHAGEPVAEVLKLAALLVFGALLSWRFLSTISVSGYIFAVAALLLVRPTALLVALVGNPLPRKQWIAAAWFGPKGFASVVYSLLVIRSDIDRAERVFHLAAIVIGLSIIAHSSTDVPVAQWLAEEPGHATRNSDPRSREV